VLEILTLTNGSLEENCYFLHAPGRSDGLLIDPGSSPEELRKRLDAEGFKPLWMLATHAHFDHVGAVHALALAYGARFACPRLDEEVLDTLEDTYAFYGMGPTQRPKVDRWLEGGESLNEAGLGLQVLFTPGHTPGGVCYYHAASGNLFSGDTLFSGSIGRSDLPGGDSEQLLKSIRTQLFSLPDAVKVHPGHGPATQIGREKRQNPFVR
jgi:glyoxylase-like metal-dependent hydrolase (beta-lactamase superfamily II)